MAAAVLQAACTGPRVPSADDVLGTTLAWSEEPPATSGPAPPAPQRGVGELDPGIPPGEPAVWSLDAVLAHIARANPTLGSAQARLEEAEALRQEAVASYVPALTLGLDFVSTDNPAQAFALLLNQQRLTLGPSFDPTPGSIDNWHTEIRLDWPLFAPGRSESRHAAAAGEEAARLAREAFERRLLNAGVQAWLGLRAARALEEVAAESVTVVERRLAQTRIRHEEGLALRADVLLLAVRLAEPRQEAARTTLAVREAESSLNHLMGRGPKDRGEGGPLLVGDEDVVVGAALPGELPDLLQLAETERRDLLATAHRVRALGYQRGASRAERLPLLLLFGAYYFDGADLAFDEDLDSYAVGAGLRLPVTAGTGARIRQAEAQERRAREELRELALAVVQEVHDAWEALRVAEETLKLAEASVGAAEEAYRIVAEAQDAGGATVTDVLEAEDARRNARVRHVAARAGVQIVRARLVGATGGVR